MLQLSRKVYSEKFSNNIIEIKFLIGYKFLDMKAIMEVVL